MPGENLLIVIGIDKYKSESNKLENAVFDALRFKKVLEERYGYSVLLNPILDDEATRKRIKQAFLLAEEKSYKDDNLIIYFAGHGYQNDWSKKGAWIPLDGEEDRTEWIAHSDIIAHIENIPAKHILLISDSCFSGTFISREREYTPPATLEELEKKDSRWVFVSGGEQRVKDGQPGKGSPFGAAVYEFLSENEIPAVNAEKLFNHVITAVQTKLPAQIPAANYIHCDSNKGGQLIFRLSSEAAAIRLKELQEVFFALNPFPNEVDYQSRTILAYSPINTGTSISTSSNAPQSLEVIIAAERKVTLLGSPGSGKSIELQRLGSKLAQAGSSFVPIYKRLNGYSGESLEDYLPKGWTDINHESIVILLDGLDEIQPKHFSKAIREISLLAKQNPIIRIVVSCRTNYYELPEESFTGTLEGFNVYYLSDLSMSAVSDYIQKKLGINGQNFIEDAYNHSFFDIIQKPFFLDILVRHYDTKKSFSVTRKLIMEEHLLRLMKDRKVTEANPFLNDKDLFHPLEQIAFIMETMGRNYLTNDEFEMVASKTGFSTRLRELPFLNYSIIDDKWQFDHNNIQEYLASRIISRCTFEEIIKAITIPNTKRIKPSWANTLSFFISIANEETYKPILNWLLENEVEYLVRFETERVSREVRIDVVKRIFNFYTSQGIVIRSNKFTSKELMRFGESIEILDFLIEILEEGKIGSLAQINALHLLENFNLSNYQERRIKLLNSLSVLLKSEDIDPHFIYMALSTLAAVPIYNDSWLVGLVETFRNNINQYIRAGLYYVISRANAVDDYLDVFLEGLDLSAIKEPIGNRGNVNLLDESFMLHEGLKKVKTINGIKKLLTYLNVRSHRNLFYHSDFREVFVPLIRSAVNLFKSDESIYRSVLDIYLTAGKYSDDEMAKYTAFFFELSDTRWSAFKEVWADFSLSTYEKSSLISKLIDSQVLKSFKSSLDSGIYTHDDLVSFYEIIYWRKMDIPSGQQNISELEDYMISKDFSHLIKHGNIDWKILNLQREQASFDLLFDIENMKREVESIFEALSPSLITSEQLHELRLQRYDTNNQSNEFILSAIELLSDLDISGRNVEKGKVLEWIGNEEYYYYQGVEIYKSLKRNADLSLTREQELFILQWTQTQAAILDKEQLLNNDNTVLMIIWYYINRFDINLPKNILLFFTEYYNFESQYNIDNPGTIEQLEKHLPKKDIIIRVKRNISTHNLPALSWLNNASYAIRNDLHDIEKDIFYHLTNVTNQDHLYGELLQFYFDKYKKADLIIKLIQSSPITPLKQKAIRILVQSGGSQLFLSEYLERMFHEELALESKIFAANQLMYMNQLNGLLFAVELLSEYPQEWRFQDNIFHNVNKIRDIRAVPVLLDLLLQTEPDYIESRAGFFRSHLLDTIYNIGWQSELNFQEVKQLLLNFIRDQGGIHGSFSFINSIILKMEEQLVGQMAQGQPLDVAMLEFQSLSKH